MSSKQIGIFLQISVPFNLLARAPLLINCRDLSQGWLPAQRSEVAIMQNSPSRSAVI
jgi:hypothetical protein